jgi:hypothetical protein
VRSHFFLTPMSPDGTPGVVREVLVNDEGPQQFVAPVPYFAAHDAAATTTAELEKERDALLAELSKLKGGARSKADHRIRVLEREIRAALDAEEVARRNAERVKERQRQQVSADSPFPRQAAMPTQQVKNTFSSGWDKFLATLDVKLAAKNLLAPLKKKVCCSGNYLCTKCQAEAA